MFKLGEEMGFKPGAKLKYMALGQGMGPKAQEFIETGVTRGLWIMLQNCHLLPKWVGGRMADRYSPGVGYVVSMSFFGSRFKTTTYYPSG